MCKRVVQLYSFTQKQTRTTKKHINTQLQLEKDDNVGQTFNIKFFSSIVLERQVESQVISMTNDQL